MAAATVSRLGQVNAAGDVQAIFLEVYSGMVLGAYNDAQTTEGRHIERSIDSGKTAQFPALGKVGSAFHVPGAELVFQVVNHAKKNIAIDGLLVSPIFIDLLDDLMNHYDVQVEYARQQGEELATQKDQKVLRAFVAASRTATPTVTGLPGGDRITAATIGTDAAVLKAGIYDAAEDLDEHSVPESERYLWVAPAQYYLLLTDGEFIDRDFNDPGNGSRATAGQAFAAQFMLLKTNNLPRLDDTSNTALPVELRLDYQASIAVAGHRSAAGTVKLLGLVTEMEYDINRQGDILVAKYAQGHNFLRPEAAVELATA